MALAPGLSCGACESQSYLTYGVVHPVPIARANGDTGRGDLLVRKREDRAYRPPITGFSIGSKSQ